MTIEVHWYHWYLYFILLPIAIVLVFIAWSRAVAYWRWQRSNRNAVEPEEQVEINIPATLDSAPRTDAPQHTKHSYKLGFSSRTHVWFQCEDSDCGKKIFIPKKLLRDRLTTNPTGPLFIWEPVMPAEFYRSRKVGLG